VLGSEPALITPRSDGLNHALGSIHSKLVLPHDAVSYHRDILAQSKVQYKTRLTTMEPYPDARKILLILMSMKSCANPDCGLDQPTGTSWGRCKKCERVMYCGKDCQIIDVSHSSFSFRR
jgi:hypothetical protein